MKIAVVGAGFVGSAVAAGFQKSNPIVVDPKLGYTVEDLVKEHQDLGAAFICVPTPMGENGSIDCSIVEKVLQVVSAANDQCLLVLKSTVTPANCKTLSEKYKNFVYNPEFLTEANAVHDFVNPFMHVFGGELSKCLAVEAIYAKYSSCKMNVPVHYVTPEEASLIKYGINSFLSTKVMFMNQWASLCEQYGADYTKVSSGMGTDPRITTSHMKVPGPDGRKGFGSACFAKDVPAIINEGKFTLSILREVWNSNCDTRNSYPEPLPREKEQHIEFNYIFEENLRHP